MLEGLSLKVRIIFLGMTVGAILVPLLLIAIFVHPQPISRNAVLGCYTALGAPSLDVGPDLIRIMEPRRRTFSYEAEPAKEGYRFAVSPSLSLRSAGAGRYAFVRDQRGTGYFWPLLPEHSDDPRNMRSPLDYGGRFQILALDGGAIVYGRTTDAARCRERPLTGSEK